MGDSPRRLDDASAHVAAWSADGKEIAYGKGSDVYLAKADGTDARRIATMKNVVSGIAIEPGGKTVQVETEEISQIGTGLVAGERTIWNVPRNGSSARPLIPEWHNTNECCGRWTKDQKFFVFESRGQIWTLPRAGRFFDRHPQPVQLTASPMQLRSPLPGKDGKKLFVIGTTFRGELSKFDLKTGSASPFLGGISADWIDVSRDGKQVLYASYPQGDLWRSSLDGADRMQLTFGPVKPVLARWSPDGQSVLFFDFPGGPGKPGKIYMMPATGGTPRQLLPGDKENEQDPTWSSDGKRIAFGGDANDAARSTEPGIRILDVQSGIVSPVPGSIHMFSPRWSPDGLNLAAMSDDSTHLMLFDFSTQKWKKIAIGTFSWINWSRDGHYIYLIDSPGKGDTVARVRISDGKLETLVHLKGYVLTGLGGHSVSVAPDDSPLLLLDRGTQDVYSLDWIEP